jgi:hypothetical protein
MLFSAALIELHQEKLIQLYLRFKMQSSKSTGIIDCPTLPAFEKPKGIVLLLQIVMSKKRATILTEYVLTAPNEGIGVHKVQLLINLMSRKNVT